MTNPGAVEMLRTHYHEMRRMDLEELAEAMPDGPDKESVLKSAVVLIIVGCRLHTQD